MDRVPVSVPADWDLADHPLPVRQADRLTRVSLGRRGAGQAEGKWRGQASALEAKGCAPRDGGPDCGSRRSRFRSRVNPATLRCLELQGTVARARVPDVQQPLTAAVDDLQQVIQDIRAEIFELPGGSFGITGCASASTRRSPASPDRSCTPRCNSAAPLSVGRRHPGRSRRSRRQNPSATPSGMPRPTQLTVHVRGRRRAVYRSHRHRSHRQRQGHSRQHHRQRG
jgi:hypothetical protein